MSKIKVGIWGTGAIARVHANAFLNMPTQTEIVAVCDNVGDKAAQFVKELKLASCHAFTDGSEFIKQNFDLVCLCLPPQEHCNAAIAAFNQGKHVVVEKPMARSLDECDAMMEASAKNHKLLAVVCQNRFKTPHQRIKTLLTQEALGTLRQVTVNSLWWRGSNYYDLSWRGTWATEGGGCLMSHAVHHLDLLLYLVGKPLSVIAQMSNVAHTNSECEDIATAILNYPHAQGQLTASLVYHGEEQEIIIQGDRGKLAAPFSVSCEKALENGFPTVDESQVDNITKAYLALPELKIEGHEALLQNVIDAICGKEKLACDAQSGRDVIELITAIYKSAALKQEVFLPISGSDPFYAHDSRIKLMPHFYEKTVSIDSFSTNTITLGRDVGR